MLQFIPNAPSTFLWAMSDAHSQMIHSFESILFKGLIKPGKPVNRFANQFEWFVQFPAARADCAFTPDATCANKARYSRVVGRLNILNLLASFAREIFIICAWNLHHSRVKFTSQQMLIRVMGGASATVNSTGNGGALNRHPRFPHLLCTLWSTNKQKLGLHDKSHVIVMHISSVRQVLWSPSRAFRWSCI